MVIGIKVYWLKFNSDDRLMKDKSSEWGTGYCALKGRHGNPLFTS